MSSPHLASDPARGQRSIALNGWTVTSTKLPILSIPEADAASDALDLALPEIIFGNNALTLRHEESGLQIRWDAREMLAAVKKGEGWDKVRGAGAVSVAHAEEWKRGQSASTSSTASLTVVKPYDWTYTTLHRGSYTLSPASSPSSPSTSSSSFSSTQAPPFTPAPPSHRGIPLAQLARTDIPILFFDEVPLFEDELGDNGIADCTVRVRVNHLSLYALARFFLRIDGVLFRLFEVRVFHAFGSGEVVREVKGREADYEVVRARLRGASGGAAAGAGGKASPSTGRTAPPPSKQRATSPLVALPNRSGFASSSSPMSPRSPAPSPSPSLAPTARTPSPSASLAGKPVAAAGEDLSQLNDLNWVAQQLEQVALEAQVAGLEVDSGNGGEGDGEEEGEERWEGLGVRLEVMRIPGPARRAELR
ncbi:hypothetical protein JCM6882_001507 [Rhodosporidiobolus microsporus]